MMLRKIGAVFAAILAFSISIPAPSVAGIVAPPSPIQVPITNGATPTIALVGDSITTYGVSLTNTLTISSTTAGQTSVTLTQTWKEATLKAGDLLYLCNVGGSVCETSFVDNSWAGPGASGATVPLTTTLANSSLVSATVYSGRMPSIGSWLSIALARLGQPLALVPLDTSTAPLTINNATGFAVWGISGGTSDQLMGKAAYTDALNVTSTNNYVTKAIASGARYIHILIGTNDVATGVAASTIITNIGQAVAQIQAAGRIPIVGTLLPNDSAGMTAARYNVQAQVNAYIRGLGKSGILVADYNRWLASPDTGLWIRTGQGSATWGIPANTYYTLGSDKVHPSTYEGAFAMASAFVQAMQSQFSPQTLAGGTASDTQALMGIYRPIMGTNASTNFDVMYSSTYGNNPRGNALSNGQFGGTGGSAPSGTVATSWSGTATRVPASGSITWTGNVARAGTTGNPYDRGYSQTVVLAQGGGTDYGQFLLFGQDVVSLNSQTPGPNTWQAGDRVYGAVNIKLTSCGGSGTTHTTYPKLQLNFYAGATQIGEAYALTYNEPSVIAHDPMDCPTTMQLQTLPVIIPPGTTVMKLVPGGDGIGTFTLSDAEIRKW